MPGNTCARPVSILAAMLFLWMPARSQGIEYPIKGELLSAAPHQYSEYFVELIDNTHRTSPGRVDVRGDGSFEFRGVQAGEYSLVVTNLRGDTVHQQLVSLTPATSRLEIRMPGKPASPPGAATVSVKQLLHPPTKKAFQSFREAQRFSESGDYTRAAEALERAVHESPDYADAHVNLGAQYVRTGRFEAAIAELKRGMEIGGPTVVVLCNLASAQARTGMRAEAIESARWALRIDSGALQGHLILGAMLAGDPQTREEGIGHLRVAAEKYNSARDLLKRLGRE
jgi:tetratricopeptide (TPR) repeat protein